MKNFVVTEYSNIEETLNINIYVHINDNIKKINFDGNYISNKPNSYYKKVKLTKDNLKKYFYSIRFDDLTYDVEKDEFKTYKDYLKIVPVIGDIKNITIYVYNDIKYIINNYDNILYRVSKCFKEKLNLNIENTYQANVRLVKNTNILIRKESGMLTLYDNHIKDMYSVLLNEKIDFDIVDEDEYLDNYINDVYSVLLDAKIDFDIIDVNEYLDNYVGRDVKIIKCVLGENYEIYARIN